MAASIFRGGGKQRHGEAAQCRLRVAEQGAGTDQSRDSFHHDHVRDGEAARHVRPASRRLSKSRRAGPAEYARGFAASAERRASKPADACEVACRSRQSTDRTRGRQSLLADVLRPWDREDQRGFRLAGRSAEQSGSARLARDGVCPDEMGCQSDAAPDCHLGRLSAILEGHARSCSKRILRIVSWPVARDSACRQK